ncbi:MAG: hypothetical protein WCP64_03815 [Actinomycetes bacterium]
MKRSTKIGSTVLALALTAGTVQIAEAAQGKHVVAKSSTTATKVVARGLPAANNEKTVLDVLVAKGTITAAQESAIIAAFDAARPTPPIGMGGFAGKGGMGGQMSGLDNVIITTLGITQANLEANEQAGKTLASLAGAKTAALISAIVAYETTQINAQVTAGRLTAAQAQTLITGLPALVTTAVNTVGGSGMGMGAGMGGRGHGRGPGMGMGGTSTLATPVAPTTAG